MRSELTPIDEESLANLSDDELAELAEAYEQLHLREQRENIVAFALNTEVPGTPSPYSENDRIKILKRKEALRMERDADGRRVDVEDVEPDDVGEDEFYPEQLELAEHHQLMLEVMQALIDEEPIQGPLANGHEDRYADGVIFMLPPGAAKSSFMSVVAPSFVLGRYDGLDVITTSYAADLARRFGRRVRHIVRSERFNRQFGVSITSDNQAVDQWSLSNGSTYKAVGILGGVTGSRGDCLPGNTLIETSTGRCRIDRIRPGDYVRSYDRKSQRPCFRRVLAVSRRRADELWRVRTAAGHVLEATGNHRFYVGADWAVASSLRVGDVLLRALPQGSQGAGQAYKRRQPHSEVLQQGLRVIPRHGPGRLIALARSITQRIRSIRGAAGNVAGAQGHHHGRPEGHLPAQPRAHIRDLLMRAVRQAKELGGARGHKGTLAAQLLQRALRYARKQQTARDAGSNLQELWHAHAARSAKAARLLKGMQAGACSQKRPGQTHRQGARLRDLWQSLQANYEYEPWALLFPSLQFSGASGAHGGQGQSCVARRRNAQSISGRQRPEIQSSQEGGTGARWRLLHCLSQHEATAWPSRRWEQSEQCRREHSDALRAMPLGISRSGAGEAAPDTVAMVERVREECDVYDIQVEQTQCFFANDILVHNCVIIDDPIAGREEAESEVIREKTWQAIKDDVFTRLKPKGKIALALTRWHEDDPAGRILGEDWSGESGLWEGTDKRMWLVLRIPLISDRDDDPLNRARGQRLWPNWFDERFVELARAQGERSWNSLYQQNPSAADGNILLKSAWRCWPHGKAEPTDEQRANPLATKPPKFGTWRQCVLVYDTALKDDEQNDYSAMTAWLSFERSVTIPQRKSVSEKQQNLLMIGAWRAKIQASELLKAVLDHVEHFKPDRIVIEDKASGIQLIQELRKRRPRHEYGEVIVEAWLPDGVPGTKGKVPRAWSASLTLNEGSIWYMPGHQTEAVIKEAASFPNGRSDDWVDTVTCLTAGHLIALRRGLTPIEDVTPGDEALTPLGWRKVLAAGPTGVRPVISRHGLTGTADHPVFTIDAGWANLGEVTVDVTVSRANLCNLIRTIPLRPWNTGAGHLSSWASANTTSPKPRKRMAGEASRGFMWPFGKTPMARFRTVTRSTIRAATHLTAALRIWSAYRRLCIAQSLTRLRLACWSILRPYGRKQWLGTARQKVANGIARTHSAIASFRRASRAHGLQQLKSPFHALLAASNLNGPTFASASAQSPAVASSTGSTRAAFLAGLFAARGHAIAASNSSIVTFGKRHAQRAAATSEPQSAVVYNLQIEGVHCYYANGVLVHNCMILYSRKTNLLEVSADALSTEEVEEIEEAKIRALEAPRPSYGFNRSKPYSQAARGLYGRT